MINKIENNNYYYFKVLRKLENYYKGKKINDNYSKFFISNKIDRLENALVFKIIIIGNIC